MEKLKTIIISRTDNLGDVVLTLPLCGILKAHYPEIKILFIGKAYTKPLIIRSKFVDEFIDREDVVSGKVTLKANAIVHVFPDEAISLAALKARIKIRIGTSHRWFHWFTSNTLINFTRKKSDLHEVQLNIKLLHPLGIKKEFPLNELWKYYGLQANSAATENAKRIIILHPKSKGSAREWHLENYCQLASQLDKNKYEVYVTGTKAEGEKIATEMPDFFKISGAIDLTGKLTLDELITFIAHCDTLIACSTGPLHIAAAYGKQVIGFYPSLKPMHSGRWKPIGQHVKIFELEKQCNDCKITLKCACINSFGAKDVIGFLEKEELIRL